MNPYDQTHILANVLRTSEEYKAYAAAKEKAFQNDANTKLIKRFKKLQFRAQTAAMQGEKIPQDVQDELQRMGNVLQFNRDVSDFLAAEYRINQLMNDVFKILGEAVDLDLSFMDKAD